MNKYNGIVKTAIPFPNVEVVNSYIDIDIHIPALGHDIRVRDYGSLDELIKRHGFSKEGQVYDVAPMRGKACVVIENNGVYALEKYS